MIHDNYLAQPFYTRQKAHLKNVESKKLIGQYEKYKHDMGIGEHDDHDITLVKSNKKSDKILKTLEKKDHWLSKPFLERQY